MKRLVKNFKEEAQKGTKGEKEFRNAERRFRLMIYHADDGVLVADAEKQKFIQGNKRICEMLGYNFQEIKELRINDIHPRKNLLKILDQFDKLSRREIFVTQDIPVKRKDGSIFYADIGALRITLGKKIYLMGFFRDITGRNKA